MRIEIDTNNKTVIVKSQVNIKELTDTLQEMLGKDYRDYSIQMDTIKESYPIYPNPVEPLRSIWQWQPDTILCDGTGDLSTFTKGEVH